MREVSKILTDDLRYTFDQLNKVERFKFQNSKILVTGCAGFLGYYFLHFFASFAEELHIKRIIALDNFSLGSPKWLEELNGKDGIEVRQFDVSRDELNAIEGVENVDYVIHMASIASPHFYRMYPVATLDANVWGLRRLFEYYKDKHLKGFLFYSSSEIYGDPDAGHIPTDEEYRGFVSATGPRACYDESKRFGETMCRLFSEQYHMPITVVRPFNNYGPGMKLTDKRVPADFAKNIYENQDIVMLSDGTPTRTFCYIADAIAGYLKALVYGTYDYFNIGTAGPEFSIKDLAELYVEKGRKVFGYTGTCRFKKADEAEYLTHNPQRRCPNVNKAKALLGYEAKIEVFEGVERFLEHVKQSSEGDLVW